MGGVDRKIEGKGVNRSGGTLKIEKKRQRLGGGGGKKLAKKHAEHKSKSRNRAKKTDHKNPQYTDMTLGVKTKLQKREEEK